MPGWNAGPNDPLNKAWEQINNDDYAGALATLEPILAKDPGNVLALVAAGSAHYELENYEPALTYAQRACELAPDLNDAWSLLGRVSSAMGNGETAAEAFEKALSLDANDTSSLFFGGYNYLERNEYDKALGYFRRLTEILPKSYLAWTALGDAYVESKDLEKALGAYRAALGVKPDSYLAWIGVGRCYARQKSIAPAVEAFLKAADLAPTSGEPWTKAAHMFIKIGDYGRAENLLNKAAEVEPDLKEILCFRALAALCQGRKEEGWNGLASLVSKHPTCRKCLAKDEDFEPWRNDAEFQKLLVV